MSQPTAYTRKFSFTNDQTANPSTKTPGNQLDIEYNAILLTLNQMLANLALIQRDDGRLANGSVGSDQLDPSVQTGVTPASLWTSPASYTAGATVFVGSKLYRCLVSHISGTFATDLANGDWLLIGDFTFTVTGTANEITATSNAAGVYTLSLPAALTFTGKTVAGGTFSGPTLSSPTLTGASTSSITPTWTGTHTWAVPSGTAQSILVNGSLPSTGTATSSFNFVEVNGVNQGFTVGGSTLDAFGGLPATNTIRATYTANGGSAINSAVWGAAKQTAPCTNLTGIIGSAYSNITAVGDALWGIIGFTNTGPNGHNGAVIALEGESVVATGGQVDRRVGVSANSQSGVKGTLLDAAFTVSMGPAAGSAPYDVTGPWKNGFVLSRILYGNAGPPLSTDGTVFYADTAFTTSNYSDMGLVTFTGNLFKFTNFAMDANGYTVIGAGVSALPSGDSRFTVTGSTRGIIENFVAQNGVSGVNGFQVTDSAVSTQMFIGVAEASNTTSRFGVTLGGYAEIVSYNTASNGLLLGTVSNKPVVLGTNNNAVMRLETDGGVTVPPAVTGGDKGAGTINASGLFVKGNAVVATVKRQVFTASGTYTPSTGMLYCIIECVGGGGGGGAAAGAGGVIFSGAGGGSGGYSRLVATAATIGVSQAVTVGGGGAGGLSTPANGSNGTDTSVGALCVAKGGAGGKFGSTGQVPTGGAGGIAGTGDVTATGAAGLPGFYNSANVTIAFPSGSGGSSYFGGGAQGVNANSSAVAGLAATNYGGGGSGAATNNIAANAAGGNGSNGVVFITEFCSQ